MRFAKCVFLAVFVLLFASQQYLSARQKESATRAPVKVDCGLEVTGLDGESPFYSSLDLVGNLVPIFGFRRVPGWVRPATQTDDVSGVWVNYIKTSDAVKLIVHVRLGKSDSSILKYGPDRSNITVAEFSLSPGETIAVNELAQFGIQPITLTVVPPRTLNDIASITENRTQHLEVVRIERTTESFVLGLKNSSTKNALAACASIKGGASSCTMTQLNHPLAKPGQVYQFRIPFRFQSRNPKTATAEAPDAPEFIVNSVVYSDLTYEGDIRDAVKLISEIEGREITTKKILSLIRAEIAANGTNSAGEFDRLKQQVSDISDEPDSSMVKEISNDIAQIPDDLMKNLSIWAKQGIASAKRQFTMFAKSFEQDSVNRGIAFQKWLITTRNSFESQIREK